MSRLSATASMLGLLLSVGVLGVVCGCDRDKSKSESSAAAGSAPAPASAAAAAVADPTPAKPAKPGPLNVLLLTVDSLRADMPWTGYPREIAPNLSKVAAQAVVYENAYSISSYTAKSVATLLSGQYPSSLYRSGWFFAGYGDANQFLPEFMQKDNVRTLSAHAHLYFDRGKNLNQGFDVWELVKGLQFDAQTDNSVTSDKLTDLAISLLSEEKNTSPRFFAWFHYMDPHDKYIKHEESPDFGSHNRDRYDSEVFFADLHIERLLDFCRKQPWWAHTALIVSADHGEAFGEHGMYKHAFEVWEVLTRVPLLVLAPKAPHRVIEQRRSHIDVAPTIADLMDIKVPDGLMKGRSLVDEVYGGTVEDREPIVLDLPEDSHNPHRRAVIQGDYKLIVFGTGQSYQLYNLRDDPSEENDLAKKELEKLAEYKALFERTYEKIPQIEPFGGMKLKSGRTANGPTAPPAAKSEN